MQADTSAILCQEMAVPRKCTMKVPIIIARHMDERRTPRFLGLQHSPMRIFPMSANIPMENPWRNLARRRLEALPKKAMVSHPTVMREALKMFADLRPYVFMTTGATIVPNKREMPNMEAETKNVMMIEQFSCGHL